MSLRMISQDPGATHEADGTAYEKVAQAHGVMLDWDGCVAFHDRPSDAALRFLREHWHHAAIVSNNSTLRPADFAQILNDAGIPMPANRIFLAGAEALRRAKELAPPRVMIIGDAKMKVHARAMGINIVRDEADLVVLMRDTRFSYAKLCRAVNCIRAGAKLVVANPDLTHPGLNGRVVPETGALLAALQTCLGNCPVDMEIIGKPNLRLFDQACRALGVRPANAVMIGDNPDTDGAGAEALGASWVMIGGRSAVSFDDLLFERAPSAAIR